jgi:DNA-binding GntR family transcriptional regulator
MAAPAADTATTLQRELAWRIAGALRSGGAKPGDPVNQLALAKAFGVSRTPVRAALELLAETGFVRLGSRGVLVADPTAAVAPPGEDEGSAPALIARLARDRHIGALAADVTEADLIRRYGASRAVLLEALRRLSNLGMVMRKPGFGWRFLVSSETRAEKQAAYRFRLAIEPAALLEPGFKADPRWIARMRADHRRYLALPWRDDMAVPFFEMNAAFHLGLVGFSGNRFFIQATEQQISLRRLRNYSWRIGEERVRVSCQDHLAILDALGAGDAGLASARMRQHLLDTAEASATFPVAEDGLPRPHDPSQEETHP